MLLRSVLSRLEDDALTRPDRRRANIILVSAGLPLQEQRWHLAWQPGDMGGRGGVRWREGGVYSGGLLRLLTLFDEDQRDLDL